MEKFVVSCISSLLLFGIIYIAIIANGDTHSENTEEKVDEGAEVSSMEINNRRMESLIGGRNNLESIEQRNIQASLSIMSQTEDEIVFKYEVSNIGKNNVVIDFSTSQVYDYELIKKGEGIIEKYSKGKEFLDDKKTIAVSPKEPVSYEVKFSQLEKGEYEFSMWLTSAVGISTMKRVTFIID